MYLEVLLSKPMVTISFKADDSFRKKLDALSKKKGINLSAYIKLILTEGINEELADITENGLTVAEELSILSSAKNDKVYGPFKTTKELFKALKQHRNENSRHR